MTHTQTSLALALACGLGLAALPATAQEKPPQSNVTGSVTVGAQTGSGIDESSKLQQYETVPTGVFLEEVTFDWRTASNYFVTFEGTKLGLADQYAFAQAGKKNVWDLSVLLTENPRWFSNTAVSPYVETTPGVFRLSDGMRQTLQRIWSPYTAGGDPAAPANSNDNRFWSVRDFINPAFPVDLRYERKTGGVGFDLAAIRNWTFKVDYQRETRNGSEPLAFTHGPGIDEVANPVDFTTQNTRAEAEWTHKKAFVNVAFTHSTFTDGVLYTTVDNPVRFNNTDYFWTSAVVNNTNANATSRLWNAPSNKAEYVDYAAGILLPAHHKLTFTGSNAVMTVDQAFIPQATNPNLGAATPGFTLTPEYASFNGKLTQSLYVVNFNGDPKPKFGYGAFYRAFDLKDHTPTYVFHSTVNSDGGASYSATGTASTQGARGFSNGQFKAHVTPARGLRVGVNAGYRKDTYEDRMFADVKDTTYGVTLDANRALVGFHGGYTRLNRNPGGLATGELDGEFETILDPNARMKDVARQNANLYNAVLTLTPIDKGVVSFSVQGIDSTFPDTRIGLKKSTINDVGVDFTYAFTARFDVSAGYIYEKYHMDTNLWYSPNGNGTTPATNTVDQYFNTISDKVNTVSAGFRATLRPEKVDIGSSLNYSKGRSNSGFTIVPGGQAGGDLLFPTNTTTVNFPQMGPYLNSPEVFNALTIWKTWFDYHVDRHFTLSVLYWYQKFDQADWAYDMLAPYRLPGSALYASTPGAVSNIYPLLDPSANRAIFLGATVPNYNANIVRASLTYRF
jgi:hypothetical protein